MATLTEAVLQEGIEIGAVKALVDSAKSMMRNLGCDADVAIDILSIEECRREELARLVMEPVE